KPDENTQALWLEDELQGDVLAAVEQWAAGQPEMVAAREEVRRWRATMASSLPSEVEPPYPDFFNHRIRKEILGKPRLASAEARPSHPWRTWLLPLAACIGMAFTFWMGTRQAGPIEYDVTGAPRAIPVDPILYTPENGVEARWLEVADGRGTLIVLDGVAAIPDDVDFSRTAYIQRDDEADRASANNEHTKPVGP
ncbi:MAG: hypothetical protein ACO3RV_02930, partial [Luteolibacter sp.]